MSEEQGNTAESTEENAESLPQEAQAPETKEAAPEAKTEAKTEPKQEAGQSAADLNWRNGIKNDDFRKAAERFNSLDDVFNAVSDLRGKLSNRVALPGEDASEEEVERFRKAFGIPESAEAYTITPPEGEELLEADTQFIDALKPMAFENGIPQEAFQGFYDKMVSYVAEAQEAQAELRKNHAEESREGMQKEWGSDYSANESVANRSMTELSDQIPNSSLAEFITGTVLEDGTMLGDHPEMLRLFAHLGRRMSEDGVMAPVASDEASDLETKIDELTAKAHAASASYNKAEADRLFRERDTLAQRLFGDAPIVGSAGRGL
jgi:hypothetical protein